MSETASEGPIKTTPIAEIKAITESRGRMFRTRAEISQFVEPPLVSACERLWDLNIRTLESSANSQDVGENGAIVIDHGSLSDVNKKIAVEFAELATRDEVPVVLFKTPITTETTLEQIKQKADEFAEHFKKQKATWIPSYSLDEMRQNYADNNAEFGPEDFVKEGWFYDEKSQKFYSTEEHFLKATEPFDQSFTEEELKALADAGKPTTNADRIKVLKNEIDFPQPQGDIPKFNAKYPAPAKKT